MEVNGSGGDKYRDTNLGKDKERDKDEDKDKDEDRDGEIHEIEDWDDHEDKDMDTETDKDMDKKRDENSDSEKGKDGDRNRDRERVWRVMEIRIWIEIRQNTKGTFDAKPYDDTSVRYIARGFRGLWRMPIPQGAKLVPYNTGQGKFISKLPHPPQPSLCFSLPMSRLQTSDASVCLLPRENSVCNALR